VGALQLHPVNIELTIPKNQIEENPKILETARFAAVYLMDVPARGSMQTSPDVAKTLRKSHRVSEAGGRSGGRLEAVILGGLGTPGPERADKGRASPRRSEDRVDRSDCLTLLPQSRDVVGCGGSAPDGVWAMTSLVSSAFIGSEQVTIILPERSPACLQHVVDLN
jgi:hypothetical protein